MKTYYVCSVYKLPVTNSFSFFSRNNNHNHNQKYQ